MEEFFRSQIDYIYFVYGMSFFVLFGSAFLLFKDKKQKLPWLSLALFGLVHAANEWLDLAALSAGDYPAFRFARLAVLILSFVFLFHFFLSSLRVRFIKYPILFFLLFVVYLGWYFSGANGLNFTARYILGFVGGFAAAIVLISSSFKVLKIQKGCLFFTGIALGSYSLTQLVVSNPPAFFTNTLFNQELFFSFFCFPIQLLRCILASFSGFLLLCFWYYSVLAESGVVISKRDKNQVLWVVLVYFVLIVIGWQISQAVGAFQKRIAIQEFLTKVNTAAGPINFKRVESLSASLDDINSLDFVRLKEELEAFDKANEDVKFVYLMRFKDNKIVFLVDAAPSTSVDYSPPGMVYDEAPGDLRKNFFSGKAFVSSPYQDRWGTWISAFAPIFNNQTNTIIAVIGLDIDFKVWQQNLFYHRLLGILISFALFVFFISIFIIYQINYKSRQEILVSQKELENILDSTKAWIFYKDKENRFIRVNKAYADVVGMQKKDLEGKSMDELYSKEMALNYWKADQEVILSGEPKFNIVESVETKAGRLWVQTDKFPYRDEQGNIIGVVGFAFDITEKRNLEKTIWESEDRFRTMISNVPGAIYRCRNDAFWTMDFISYAIREITGYPASDFINNKVRSYESIIYIHDRQFVRDRVESAISKNESYIIEYRIVHSNGSLRWVVERGQGVFIEGDLVCLDGAIFDYTEQKDRENRILALNRAVEQSPAVVAITDTAGILTYVNPKFTEVTGYSEAEAIGQNPRVLKSGEHALEFYKMLWETIVSGKTWHGEFHNRRKDGTLYWENAYISAVKNLKGEIINFIAVKEDITERKRILLELEQKNKELQKLDILKSEFVSVVSHELRTPLSIIKEGISLVLDGITGKINPKQDKILGTSKDSVDRLARIINNLLDISKIESGTVKLDKKLIDINYLVHKAASGFERKAKEKGLEIRFKLPHGKLELLIDEDRIFEVLVNLNGNSFKFTTKGYVQIEVVDHGHEVQCVVSDSGIGVSPENLSSLFGKFVQFDRIDGGGEKGTGLGLSIVKGLVELHGGKIWAESEFGQGMRMYFILPKHL